MEKFEFKSISPNQKSTTNVFLNINEFLNFYWRLALLISTAKQNYYSKIMEKLQNTKRSSEAYWPLLKIFLNNKKYLSFHHCITKISLKFSLRKKLNFLMLFLQTDFL